MNINEIIKSEIITFVKEGRFNIEPTPETSFEMFIRRAQEDGYLVGMESSSIPTMDAARKVANDFDELTHEEKRVYGKTLYKRFLKQIHKI